jgi:hypothetical protein
VSFVEELHAELGRAGIRGRGRRRIELELADHLASDPGSEARIGTPRELAEQFAAELRSPRTSRAAWGSFGALALAAFGLAATMRAYAAAGGWPEVGGVRGVFVAVTGLGLLVACQVAFVAGVLGIARALRLRRRGGTAPGELRLVQRRMGIALAAAAVTSVSLLAHAVLLWGLMPWWWDAVAFGSSVAAVVALALAAAAVGRARELTPADGVPPEGLDADVPDWVAARIAGVLGRPWLLAGLVGAAACLLMLVGAAQAESSLLEGLERAAAEGLAFFGCFAIFGRRLGLRT